MVPRGLARQLRRRGRGCVIAPAASTGRRPGAEVPREVDPAADVAPSSWSALRRPWCFAYAFANLRSRTPPRLSVPLVATHREAAVICRMPLRPSRALSGCRMGAPSAGCRPAEGIPSDVSPWNSGLAAGRGGYAGSETWIRLRCLTGGARRVCVLRVARVRGRLKERQAGAVPRQGSPVPLKGRDVFIAA